MTFSFNPRISNEFVRHVLNDNRVKKEIEDLEVVLNQDVLEKLAKSLLIKAFTCYSVDINDIINIAKSQASREHS